MFKMEHNGAAYAKMPDKVLMAAFKQGDLGAYLELYDRFKPKITNFLIGFEKNFSRPVKVEDIVQDTFAKLYTHGHLYNDNGAELSTWLFTIAGNLARTDMRKAKNRNTTFFSNLTKARNGFSIDNLLYGGNLTDELESQQYFRSAMQRFQRFADEHPVFRTVLLLRGFQGMDYNTIASIMKIPVGTVKSRINRARLYLRNCSY